MSVLNAKDRSVRHLFSQWVLVVMLTRIYPTRRRKSLTHKGSMEKSHIGVDAHKRLIVLLKGKKMYRRSRIHAAEINVTKNQSYNVIQPYCPSILKTPLTQLRWNQQVSTLYHHCSRKYKSMILSIVLGP